MSNILHTKRLLLREFQLSDAEQLFALNADNEVMRYTGDAPFASLAETRSFIEKYDAYQKTGMGRWAVVLISSEQFIGWCGLKQHKEFVDIGFRFFKKDWGKGYATEAANACLNFGFNTL